MTNYPKSNEKVTTYGDLTWDADKSKFKYVETTTHFCSEEAVNDYKVSQQNAKAAAEAYDKDVTIATATEELSWVAAGEATKA